MNLTTIATASQIANAVNRANIRDAFADRDEVISRAVGDLMTVAASPEAPALSRAERAAIDMGTDDDNPDF